MAEEVQVPASYMLAACCATGSRIHQDLQNLEECVFARALVGTTSCCFCSVVHWLTLVVFKKLSVSYLPRCLAEIDTDKRLLLTLGVFRCFSVLRPYWFWMKKLLCYYD